MNPLFDPNSEPVRWVRATCLLSLDEVLPYYDLMGLRPGNPDGLRRVLRRLIVTARKEERPLHEALGPDRVTAAVGAALGGPAGTHLGWWVRHVLHLDPRDNAGLTRWMWLLRRCRPPNPRWDQLGFPPGLRKEAADQLLRAIDTDEYTRRRAGLSGRPLSDWDLHLYAAVPYADDDPDGDSTPQVHVQLTITDYQGYAFWAWLLKTLQPHQIDELWQTATRVVSEPGFQALGELPDPRLLDIGL
jgi:hypothetical protein